MEQNKWRDDFPILDQKVYDKPLVYLDNAATSQMPKQVIDRLMMHYTTEHANIHRGIHFLSERSTEAVEDAREKVRAFINAKESSEIIFTSGTTDSMHLLAGGMVDELKSGIGIISTELEHHSDFVPWQQICLQTGADFFVCPAKDGELDLMEMERLLKENHIALVACGHVSNLTGTVNPIKEIAALAHAYGAKIVVDGAQGMLHKGVDVQDVDCDFYSFSGHKMLAPTGIGVLYGKKECLEQLPPSRFGGGMVDLVFAEKTTWGPIPYRFEAGTPNISGIIGLGAAISYLMEHDVEAIRAYEADLIAYTEAKLSEIEYLHILGHPKERSGVVSFVIDDVHPYDLASMIDKMGIAVRSGNHCAQPALHGLQVDSATRISPAFYNTKKEIDLTCECLKRVKTMLRKWKNNDAGKTIRKRSKK